MAWQACWASLLERSYNEKTTSFFNLVRFAGRVAGVVAAQPDCFHFPG
jgi:hypothetical protein